MVQRLYLLRLPDVLCLGRLDRLRCRAAQLLGDQFWEDDHAVLDKCAAFCQRHNKRVSHLDLLVLRFKLSKLRKRVFLVNGTCLLIDNNGNNTTKYDICLILTSILPRHTPLNSCWP